MANTYQATLDSLLPDHTWRLDELTRGVTYADTGDTGGFDLNVTASGQEAPRGFPSVGIRGTPAVYGSWVGRNIGGGPYRESGPTDVSWTTGVFNVWITPMDMSSITYTLGVFWSNNPDVGLYFQIDTNGVLRFQCRFVGTRQNNASSTAAGVITEGRPHMLTVVQRGDGNGPQLYVNGAPIATTNSFNGTGITLDSWANDVINLGVATDIAINGRGSSGGPGDIEPAIVAQPSIWINSTISDAQIALLHASANDNTNNFTDTLEWIILGLHNETEVQNDLIRLLPVWGTPSPAGPGQQVDIGPGAPVGDGLQTSGIGANTPANMNAAETSKISPFESYQYIYDAGDAAGNVTVFSIGSNTGWETSDTVGSVTAALKINQAGLDSRVFWAYGTSASNGIEVDLVSTAAPPTFRVRLIARESAVVTYTVFSDFLSDFSVAPSDDLLFVTIVQPADGGGPQIYVNGSNRTGLVTISTNPDIWCADYSSASNLRIGGEQGSATIDSLEPNGLAMVLETRKVLTGEQVTQLYQTWLGIFPVPPAPPPAGFNDTLTNTGNGDDPNGPGPDWYWRMNDEAAPLQDSGIAQLRTPTPIESDSILTGGDPTFEVGGPLPADVTAGAIYFDGLGDYFEMGVDGISGQLVDVSTGTVGGFLAANSQSDNIIYSQANDAGTAFWRLGLNSDNLVELVVQTSAGNSVTVVGNSQLFDRDFHLITATSDGTNIQLYVDGKVQILTITEVGTGSDGDWFDAFAATRNALGALASSTFPTQLTGRLSEVFIFDGDVLSAAQIATLFQAAINDGITGSTATAGVLRFEDVTFARGQFADVLASNARTDFLQVIRFNNCEFLQGAEGTASYRPQLVRAEGNAIVQAHSCRASVPFTPSFGRGGFVGSQIDPAAAASLFGSLLVVNCELDNLGYVDGEDFLAPVMAEAGFGLTAYSNRMPRANGSAIGWRADSQNVLVSKNLIAAVSSALGGIYSGASLNSAIGRNWLIEGNDLLDVVGDGIDLNGANLADDARARNIKLVHNNINNPTAVGIRLNDLDEFQVLHNEIDRCTEGVRIGNCQSRGMIRANKIVGNSATGIIFAEGSLLALDLGILENFIDGETAGDGITVTNLREVSIFGNTLQNLSIGLQLGTINLGAHIDKNNVEATTPFALLGSTTQVGLDIGNRNLFRTLGSDAILTPDVDGAITAFAGYHPITAVAADNLDTINDPGRFGKLLVLRLAAGSSTITVRDGQDNIRLAGSVDFVMDAETDQLWLVKNSDGDWHELSQQGA